MGAIRHLNGKETISQITKNEIYKIHCIRNIEKIA